MTTIATGQQYKAALPIQLQYTTQAQDFGAPTPELKQLFYMTQRRIGLDKTHLASGARVVAQLVKRSLPAPEIRGLIPNIGKIIPTDCVN